MPNFDVNSAVSFLKGYLSEQERQKAEKKIQKAMESGDWEITQQIEPLSGKQVYQLKSRQKPIPGFVPRSQTIEGINYINPNLPRQTIYHIGNNLVKLDPETNQINVLYTAPENKRLLQDSMKAWWVYDMETGKKQKILDEFGYSVEPSEREIPEIIPSSPNLPLAPKPLPPGVTEREIQFTMRKHNLTREQVLQRIK